MIKIEKEKIVVGISGGIDSSVALILLKKQGFSPIGVSLKFSVWRDKKNLLKENVCCLEKSFEIAKKICQKFEIPYFIFSAEKEFEKKVINYFISEIKKGKTPNPCIICNEKVKFQKLLEIAKKLKAPYIATGHYARVKFNKKEKIYQLLRGKDKKKDQSYYLCFLNQKILKHTIFPLGNLKKEEVKKLAEEFGIKDFFKKESQDLCFVARKSLPYFIEKFIGKKPGKIINEKGEVLGEHKGLHFYTLGQRKKLKIPGGPFYVIGFDRKRNLLIVSKNKKDLYKKEIFVSPFHFISKKPPRKKIEILCKTRYKQLLKRAILFPPKKGKIKIVFKKSCLSPTPGQFAVFYKNDICLGGGIII